jgi:hypothetical protein
VGRGNDIQHSPTFRATVHIVQRLKIQYLIRLNALYAFGTGSAFPVVRGRVQSRIRQKGMRPCARSQLEGAASMMIPLPPTHSPRKRRREELHCWRLVFCVSAHVHVRAHVSVCASRHGLDVCARARLCVCVARKLETRPAWPGQAGRLRGNGDRGRQAPVHVVVSCLLV